jgi:hypothetical protein
MPTRDRLTLLSGVPLHLLFSLLLVLGATAVESAPCTPCTLVNASTGKPLPCFTGDFEAARACARSIMPRAGTSLKNVGPKRQLRPAIWKYYI